MNERAGSNRALDERLGGGNQEMCVYMEPVMMARGILWHWLAVAANGDQYELHMAWMAISLLGRARA